MTERQDPEMLMKAVNSAVKELNGRREPARAAREVPPFVNLSEQLAASILESAQQALTEAENHMENARAYADKLRGEIKERADELCDLTERLKEFGNTMLTGHERFHGLNQKPTEDRQ